MASPFVGQLMIVPYNFAPREWAFCNGQVISIAQNTALFSLIGTTFGGNGQTTFALPDLQGRVPIHWGKGSGLSNYVLGQKGGEEQVTLQSFQMPAHTHSFAPPARSGPADSQSPVNNVPAHEIDSTIATYSSDPTDSAMRPGNSGVTGGNQSHSNIQPYLALSFIIALEGVYPSRS